MSYTHSRIHLTDGTVVTVERPAAETAATVFASRNPSARVLTLDGRDVFINPRNVTAIVDLTLEDLEAEAEEHDHHEHDAAEDLRRTGEDD